MKYYPFLTNTKGFDYMDLTKIYIGQVVKNYKEMCVLLDEEVKKGGNTKKAQIKDWERYFTYHKEGHKFVIDEIYKVPLPPNNNITKYIPLIEKLILHIIFENGADTVLYINKSKLYQMLKMINERYTTMKYHKMQLSKKYDVDSEVIKDFYNTSDDLLERNVEQAIKSLERQSLIKCTEVYSVCEVLTSTYNELFIEEEIDEYGDKVSNPKIINHNNVKTKHRRATEEETKLILSLQREQLKKLKCVDMREMYRKGLFKEFYKPINDYLLFNHNINFYYISYEFIFNKNHITEAYIENNTFLLDDESYYITSSLLNNNISDKLLDLAENRHIKSKNIESMNLNDTIRSNDNYMDDIKLLINNLIHTS